MYYTHDCSVVVLEEDFERATKVMSQVLQHWEFEPSAGFTIGRYPFLDYGLELAAKKGWSAEDISALVWSGEDIGLVAGIGLALQAHEIPSRMDTEQLRTANIFPQAQGES